MVELAQGVCESCKKGVPQISQDEVNELMPQVPDWQVIQVAGINQLQRVYKFKNFVAALAFTNRVGELAESQAHHPDILTEWGKVTLVWWSHKIKGLHRNDFVMAARSDQLYTAAE